MGILTYHSIRIYKRGGQTFTTDEAGSLRSFLFDSPLYYKKGTVFLSRFTPIIFELTENNTCIEMQFNTYDNQIMQESLERLYEMTFPFYDMWFIEAKDCDACDRIGRFGETNMNGSIFANTSRDWQTCRYAYDRIEVHGSSEIPEELAYLDWNAKSESTFYAYTSETYNSYSEKNFSDGQRYKLRIGENSIYLAEKYDRAKGGIDFVAVSGADYSDTRLDKFIRHSLKDSSIECIRFYFSGRLTREIQAARFSSVLAFDGWDNCADEGFLGYKDQRTVEIMNYEL